MSDWDTKRKRKIADITQALSVSPVDVAALRRMAISEGGLLTDEIRCQVWPRLLNVPPHVLEQEPGIMLATYQQTEQYRLCHPKYLPFLTMHEKYILGAKSPSYFMVMLMVTCLVFKTCVTIVFYCKPNIPTSTDK